MTSWAIVDTNVLIATVLNEQFSAQSVSLIQHFNDTEIRLAAPTLQRYEFVAAMRRAIYSNRLDQESAQQRYNALKGFPIQFFIDEKLLDAAFDLATAFNLPTAYDAQFLALAQRLDCPFWTSDTRLFNSTKERFPLIRFLGDFTPPSRD